MFQAENHPLVCVCVFVCLSVYVGSEPQIFTHDVGSDNLCKGQNPGPHNIKVKF